MSKLEQIWTFQTNFRRIQAGFLSIMADLSNLTEFSCMRTTPVELLDSLESSLYCSNCSYLSSSSNRMECSIHRIDSCIEFDSCQIVCDGKLDFYDATLLPCCCYWAAAVLLDALGSWLAAGSCCCTAGRARLPIGWSEGGWKVCLNPSRWLAPETSCCECWVSSVWVYTLEVLKWNCCAGCCCFAALLHLR